MFSAADVGRGVGYPEWSVFAGVEPSVTCYPFFLFISSKQKGDFAVSGGNLQALKSGREAPLNTLIFPPLSSILPLSEWFQLPF